MVRAARGRPDDVAVGATYGRWTVLGPYVRRADGAAAFPCRCACGTERDVILRTLRRIERGMLGGSCGCLQKEVTRTRRQITPGHTMTRRENWIWQNYGMTLEEWERLYDEQLGRCGVCLVPLAEVKKICVDHDHKTEEVRGLLCHHCNVGLGLLQDDSAILRRGAEYLDRVKQRAVVLD